MKDIRFRPYKTGDEKEIIALFEKVFKKPMGCEDGIGHWKWEFELNPVKPISIFLAWDRERLVGQYAVNPIRTWVSGKQIIGGLSLDTMTDPEYSGKGIFQKAAKLLYQELAGQGVSTVFGFPNGNSIYGFKRKLSWDMICVPPVYICPITSVLSSKKSYSDLFKTIFFKTHNFILRKQLKKYRKRHSNVTIRKDLMFDSWADDLWQRCCKQHDVWVVRDSIYLRWRYNDRPETAYEYYTAWYEGEISGYIVTIDTVREEGPVTFILDIMVDLTKEGIAELLVETVLNSSIEKNIALVSTILMPGSPYKKIFLKKWFFPLPRFVFPQKIYFGVKTLDDSISMSNILNQKSWHICWGDTDLL